ncbi:hypothetical protein KIW84_063107, partial [Lathyrus oleraceus]
MNPSELMNALQSKMDAQSAELRDLLKSSLASHSDTIHSTLHSHLLEVDAKVANLRSTYQHPPHGSPETASRSLKLSVPRFDGSNPIDWLFQITAFFDFHQTPENARLQIVSFHMEGRAAAWFQWAMRNHLL